MATQEVEEDVVRAWDEVLHLCLEHIIKYLASRDKANLRLASKCLHGIPGDYLQVAISGSGGVTRLPRRWQDFSESILNVTSNRHGVTRLPPTRFKWFHTVQVHSHDHLTPDMVANVVNLVQGCRPQVRR